MGLGSGGDKFYSLNLKDPTAQWQEIASFPGGERNQPVAAAVDGKLYVLGGLQKMKKASFNWSMMPTNTIRQTILG
ncbi:N-acetylneuraminate epimerase [Rodentibacter pneumotropicus]|uniref:N-acetylneuraminate epimerase n=1 Tax=Rodentibacter pneumotropicus TaxID=758 RepID=A0A448MST4_9PAST|nr:N-acetylneuraminate epimerase [Rodentibacter pneumotropicus]